MTSRQPNDEYHTPASLTQALIHTIGLSSFQDAIICEPCVGNHAIVDIFKDWSRSFDLGISYVTNDINREKKAQFHEDARKGDSTIWNESWYDWTITNPPFNHATEILKNALEHSRNIAFLLRLTYAEPTQDRGHILNNWSDLMSDFIVFGQPRPSFIRTAKSSTDSVTTAWFVWRTDWHGGTRMKFDMGWKTRYERTNA